MGKGKKLRGTRNHLLSKRPKPGRREYGWGQGTHESSTNEKERRMESEINFLEELHSKRSRRVQSGGVLASEKGALPSVHGRIGTGNLPAEGGPPGWGG